jgi:hypothetical protein
VRYSLRGATLKVGLLGPGRLPPSIALALAVLAGLSCFRR